MFVGNDFYVYRDFSTVLCFLSPLHKTLSFYSSWLLLVFLYPRAPRFKGYQQQDSQELLHYLMDSIRVEETKVSLFLRNTKENICIWQSVIALNPHTLSRLFVEDLCHILAIFAKVKLFCCRKVLQISTK